MTQTEHESSVHEMSLHEMSAIIEQVAMNKSSLELKNILQSTQSLQLFTLIKQKVFEKVKKMPISMDWAMRPCGSIKREE
jgi:hypothetical protein